MIRSSIAASSFRLHLAFGNMFRPRIQPLVVVAVTAVVVTGALCLSPPNTTPTAAASSLRASGDLKWYRGNLHTHSHWSDGDDYSEMVALWYKEHGYDFLCFTDHNTIMGRERWVEVSKTKGGLDAYEKLKARFPENWIEENTIDGHQWIRLKRFHEVSEKIAEPGKFLLIQGEEISDRFDRLPIHMNATNLHEILPPHGGHSVHEVIQRNVDAVMAKRRRTHRPIMVHLNHPNFGWGITAEDLMRVRGENFFEVYNGHPSVYNEGDDIHASTERMWDIINARRLTEFDLPLLYALATDDGHNYHNIPSRASEPGRGWVMVLSAFLSPEALIESLEAGRFYASSGVTLEEVTSSSQSLKVVVRPDPGATYRIDFIGTRKNFDSSSEPVRDKDGTELPVTRRYSSEIGQVFKSVNDATAFYEFTGDELYVRARITSSRKHPNPGAPGEFERAWTQPVRP